jgi:hypothetical protein
MQFEVSRSTMRRYEELRAHCRIMASRDNNAARDALLMRRTKDFDILVPAPKRSSATANAAHGKRIDAERPLLQELLDCRTTDF